MEFKFPKSLEALPHVWRQAIQGDGCWLLADQSMLESGDGLKVQEVNRQLQSYGYSPAGAEVMCLWDRTPGAEAWRFFQLIPKNVGRPELIAFERLQQHPETLPGAPHGRRRMVPTLADLAQRNLVPTKMTAGEMEAAMTAAVEAGEKGRDRLKAELAEEGMVIEEEAIIATEKKFPNAPGAARVVSGMTMTDEEGGEGDEVENEEDAGESGERSEGSEGGSDLEEGSSSGQEGKRDEGRRQKASILEGFAPGARRESEDADDGDIDDDADDDDD